MLLLNTTLKRAKQPSLEQRSDIMNAWHDFVSLFLPATNDRNAMFVTRSREPRIAWPSVGVNCRARLHGLSNETKQTFGGNVFDAFQSDTPDGSTIFLRRDHYDGLLIDLATSLALFRATNVGFVDLDVTSKAIPIRPYHSPAQLVHPRPCSFVAAQAQHSLQTQGADAVLLAGYEPHCKKPGAQRLAGVLEHCTSRQRRFRIACPAPKYAARGHPRLPNIPTTRTNEPVWPPQAPDIFAALNLTAKPLVHFLERARVINAGHWFLSFHGIKLSAFLTWVKGIPISTNNWSLAKMLNLPIDVETTRLSFHCKGADSRHLNSIEIHNQRIL